LIEPEKEELEKEEFEEFKNRSQIILEACDELCFAAKKLQVDSINQSILNCKKKIEDNPDDDTGRRYRKQIEALELEKTGWKIEINSKKKDVLKMVDFGMKLQFEEQGPFQALIGINAEKVFQRPQARGNEKIQPNHNPTELKKAPQGSKAINNSLKKMLCDFKKKTLSGL